MVIWLDEGGYQRSLRLIAPPLTVRGEVEHFWIQETMPKRDCRIVPDVNAHAIFSMKHGTKGLHANGYIVGARSEFLDTDVIDRVLTISVRFKPGVLPLLVRDSADTSLIAALPSAKYGDAKAHCWSKT
jgi:hypothetical protein